MSEGKLHFEDFPVGSVWRASGYRITQDEIIAFAREFDPQPFHLDPVAAAKGPTEGLIAPGMLTCSIVMRMTFDAFMFRTVGLGAPGIDETKWLRPVRPGMELDLAIEIVGARVSQSRPDTGLLNFSLLLCDQTGEPVMSQRYTGFYARRDTTPPPPAPPSPKAAAVIAPDLPSFTDERTNLTRFAARYDDVLVGARVVTGSYDFTKENVIPFAAKYDPQPFHLSDEGAANSHFGFLASSGWLTAASFVRSLVDARDRAVARQAELGFPILVDRPSPGFQNLRWVRPVRVGDRVTYDTQVISKEPDYRPGFGLARHRGSGVNQAGEIVFQIEHTSLVSMD